MFSKQCIVVCSNYQTSWIVLPISKGLTIYRPVIIVKMFIPSFPQYVLVILKQMLQNYKNILNRCVFNPIMHIYILTLSNVLPVAKGLILVAQWHILRRVNTVKCHGFLYWWSYGASRNSLQWLYLCNWNALQWHLFE